MFKNDATFNQLTEAVEAGSAEDSLRAAHSIKGMCFNLGLINLGTACSDLVDAVRGGEYDLDTLYARIRDEYEKVAEALDGCLD